MMQPIEEQLLQPEGKQLEFKRDLSSPKPLLKTLIAFANTAGGQLIIGVADNGEVIGVVDPLAEEERLTNLIADAIAPLLAAVNKGELQSLVLDFEDGAVFTLRQNQRWRFWRRPWSKLEA